MLAAIGLLFSNTWAKILPYVLIVGAVLAVLAGFYERGKSAGSAAIEAKNKDATLRATARTVSEIRAADSARSDIRALPPDRVREHDPFERR